MSQPTFTPGTPEQHRAWIQQTLDPTGMPFEWLPGAAAVAGCRLQMPNRPLLNLSVRHTGAVLQVIAHAALPGPADVQLLADRDLLNQEWGLGRAYFVPAQNSWDLSIGLSAPNQPAAAGPWAAALTSLSDAPDLIMKGHPPMLVLEYPRTPAEVMPGVHQALEAAGLQPRAAHDGEVAVVNLQMDRVTSQVHWFLTGGSLLVARAQPIGTAKVVESAHAIERLNHLNSRLDIGGVGLWYGQGMAYGWIAQPIPWCDLSPAALRWASERAASWAEAAQHAAM